MNMFEFFKYGRQVIIKLTKDGLQVIIKLTKLRSALIEHFSIHKIQSYITRPARFVRRPIKALTALVGQLYLRVGGENGPEQGL